LIPRGQFRRVVPFGRAALQLFAVFAELERNIINERAAEGRKIAKEQGKYNVPRPGARRQYDVKKFELNYTEYKAGRMSAATFASNVGLKRGTFYNRLKEYEEALV